MVYGENKYNINNMKCKNCNKELKDISSSSIFVVCTKCGETNKIKEIDKLHSK